MKFKEYTKLREWNVWDGLVVPNILNPGHLAKTILAFALSPIAGTIAGGYHTGKQLLKGKGLASFKELPKGVGRWTLGLPTQWELEPKSLAASENTIISKLPSNIETMIDQVKQDAKNKDFQKLKDSIVNLIQAVQRLDDNEKEEVKNWLSNEFL